MKKEAVIELFEKNPEADLVVRTADEEATFLANFKEQEIEKGIKPLIGDLHSRYEADFEGIVGTKKPDGMKGYKWIKDEATKLKTASDELSSTKEKLVELEVKLKDGKIDEVAKEKITDLQGEVKRLEKLHKTSKADWEEGVKKERTEFKKTRIKSELNHSMVGFKFLPKEIINDEVREPFVNKVLEDLVSIADFNDDGKLVFKNTEGEVMRGTDAAVVTPLELLQSKLKPILDNGKQQPGLGTKGEGKGKDDTPVTVEVPATVNTPLKLTTYLRTNFPDMKPQSDEYKAVFAKYTKEMQ